MERYYLCGSCKTEDPSHHLPGCSNSSIQVDTSDYLYPMEEDRRTRQELGGDRTPEIICPACKEPLLAHEDDTYAPFHVSCHWGD